MELAVGQALAYLKIFAVAAVIMGGVWALVKMVEKRGRK
jgi:hypothetical protein